jgi:hypothetical protein
MIDQSNDDIYFHGFVENKWILLNDLRPPDRLVTSFLKNLAQKLDQNAMKKIIQFEMIESDRRCLIDSNLVLSCFLK